MPRPIRAIELTRESPRLVAVIPSTTHHMVRCPSCRGRFELFGAAWCQCANAPQSKLCGACGECACAAPGYRNPRLWAQAPPLFNRQGFDRLFVAYL